MRSARIIALAALGVAVLSFGCTAEQPQDETGSSAANGTLTGTNITIPSADDPLTQACITARQDAGLPPDTPTDALTLACATQAEQARRYTDNLNTDPDTNTCIANKLAALPPDTINALITSGITPASTTQANQELADILNECGYP